MNIDERLEALAQSVELLTLDMRDLQKLNQESFTMHQNSQRMHQDNEQIHGEMMLAIARLANIAHVHND